MKILVVDDSAVQRKMIIAIIRKAGYEQEVLEAGNGRQAIEQLGTNFKDIKLVLCDWNMPELSGIEFVAAVGKIPAVNQIPLVMVTTEGTEDRIKEAYSKHPKLGGYITKPFTPEQLKSAIDKHLKPA